MKKIYLHEFNILMGNKIYLPIASGMLRASAETWSEIRHNFEFMPFIFRRDTVDNIVGSYEEPEVLAFSSSLWNHELNLAVAKAARIMHPDALIIFGGAHVPHDAERFLTANPFIDVVVRGEGEVTFAKVLNAHLMGRDFSSVKGVSYRDLGEDKVVQTPDRPMIEDLDLLPSPYLTGLYDYLIRDVSDDIEYQAIFESNRGCPFGCSFCYWGNAVRKVRRFPSQRLQDEVMWFGDNRIAFVFSADANFGMYQWDLATAQMMVAAKSAFGYPQAFRCCYGKNAEDRIFEIATLLEKAGLSKGVTLSFQSTNSQTLQNIGRRNIKLDTYRSLQTRYHQANVPVYTELILGLPGETYTSFSNGIEEILQAGLHDQIGVFLCTILPNTDMSDPVYVAMHGIRAKRIALIEPHASPRLGEVQEYEDICIGTDTMPPEDWQRAAKLAWITQVLHGYKLSFFMSLYLSDQLGVKYTDLYQYILEHGREDRFPIISGEIAYYEQFLKNVLTGQAQCVFLDEFGDISWQIEEASLLRLSGHLREFYHEFLCLVVNFLHANDIVFNQSLLIEILIYQSSRMATFEKASRTPKLFNHNVPEYFDALLKDESIAIQHRPESPQILTVELTNFGGDKAEFARQIIWFGRRDSRIVEHVSWQEDFH
ncbi:radical SAM protein [Candidatus Parcubacteria bacterium]|nr:radical SAM protein [Candidatus Parcubacteria bacterium]